MTLALGLVTALGIAQRGIADEPVRIVSAGGSITEIVYALGQQDRLVARDTTSNHPAQALELPNVGYVRRLSPEGLLSVNPDLILAEEGAGPPETFEVLEGSGLPIITIPMGFDLPAVQEKITAVAAALDVPEAGAALVAQVTEEVEGAQKAAGLHNQRILFVLSMQGGRIMAAGRNTAADGIITMAGAQNAIDGFEGYKLITDEAVITAAPDVILMMQSHRPGAITADDLLSHPALSTTPAGRDQAVLQMDGMLMLGFSVRTGQAVTELANALATAGH
ncbi:hemin ABC transporter substrate-binding protein [Shimia sp. R11_0]|nr:hemin ABC transporter substrate-binding protein [Shimia sp. R11_0]